MSSSKQNNSPNRERRGIQKPHSSRKLRGEKEREDNRRRALEAHLEMQKEDGTELQADSVVETDPDDYQDEDPDEDPDERAKFRLRLHIGIGADEPPAKVVFFFIEKAPPAIQSAGCQLPSCKNKIGEGKYRIAVHPGMNNDYGRADFYHVECFEKLVDFSQTDYLARVQPVHRNNFRLREIKSAGILDGHYLLDGGAERLVLEWKVSMGKLIDQREGIAHEPMEQDFNDLLRRSGSADFSPKRIPGMTDFEFFLLSHSLAPIESDGESDTEEWNLFKVYLPHDFKDMEDLNDRKSLSKMLTLWSLHCLLVNIDPKRLTEAGNEAKKGLSEKAIRGIKRLASIPMPNFQAYWR